MKVFKFGGASVQNEPSIRNMGKIISHEKGPLIVIVSAMGKTTNLLEQIAGFPSGSARFEELLEKLAQFHLEICHSLALEESIHMVRETCEFIRKEALRDVSPDEKYDQLVCQGEILSTRIIAEFLRHQGSNVEWLDARKCIRTSEHFREGIVDWEETCSRIMALKPLLNDRIILSQGFIGSTLDGRSTTLGREGSDYTAAIFASCLQAESVTVWKDVDGIMNGDPKKMEGTVKYDHLTYNEAAEMTYYGATVIHPKTIKPLANRNIPLLVKSFYSPEKPGTRIDGQIMEYISPAVIIKEQQCLVSFHVRDYTFINERNLSLIFHELSEANMKINMMQNSAISFSICVDYHKEHLEEALNRLKPHFSIRYNTGLELITIKNYTQEYLDRFRKDRVILLEQLSRNNYRALMD